jgi:hypothetical protein
LRTALVWLIARARTLRTLSTLLRARSELLSALTRTSALAVLATPTALRLLAHAMFAAIVLVELVARVELGATGAAREILHLGHV